MSNYVQNLVKRSVGFEPYAVISPHIMPSFASETLTLANEDQIPMENEHEYHVESSDENISITEGVEPFSEQSIAPEQLPPIETDHPFNIDTRAKNKKVPVKGSASNIVTKADSYTIQAQEATPGEFQDNAERPKRDYIGIDIDDHRTYEQQKIRILKIQEKEESLFLTPSTKHASDTSVNPPDAKYIEHNEILSDHQLHSLQKEKEIKVVNIQPDMKPAEPALKTILKPTPLSERTYKSPKSKVDRVKKQRPVHVHIGTIEVRAERKQTTPYEPENLPTFKPEGFGNYKRIRNYRNWGQ